jgi:hypothetical protein
MNQVTIQIDTGRLKYLTGLIDVFWNDPVFKGLVQALIVKEYYFVNQPLMDSRDEIYWSIVSCDVSVQESGLRSEQDMKEFALFMLQSIPVLKLYTSWSDQSYFDFD